MTHLTIEDFHALAKKYGITWIGKGCPMHREQTEWKCPKKNDHEWATSYHDLKYRKKTHTSGCPFCPTAGSSRRPSASYNLALIYPELLTLWHPTRNERAPTEYTPHSGKLVWWRCPKSDLHDWEAKPNDLINQSLDSPHRGCPYCSGKIMCADNCLAYLEPDVAAQWHPTKNKDTPFDVTIRTSKKRWWVCAFGHQWRAAISARTGPDRTGCRRCAKKFSKLELCIYCELDNLFHGVIWSDRSLGKEIDVFLPEQGIGIEIDYEHTHSGKENLDITKAELLRSHCIDLIRVREKSLGMLSPIDVPFSRPVDQTVIVMGLVQRLTEVVADQTILSELHEYLKLGKLQSEQKFKKIFARLPAPSFQESVEYLHPDLVHEWDYEACHPLQPNMFSPGSGHIVHWTCRDCGHKWSASITERTGSKKRKGTGCPACAGIVEGEGMTSRNRAHITLDYNLEILFPKIAKEYHPTKNDIPVNEVAPRSNENVWWLCENGHEWKQIVGVRTKNAGERGCKVCRSVGFCSPDLAKEWDYDLNDDTPFDVTAGLGKKRWWKCPNNHPSYESRVANRVYGEGCKKCAPQRILKARKDRREKVLAIVNEIETQGKISLQDIANEMNTRGLKTYQKTPWTQKNLRAFLRR